MKILRHAVRSSSDAHHFAFLRVTSESSFYPVTLCDIFQEVKSTVRVPQGHACKDTSKMTHYVCVFTHQELSWPTRKFLLTTCCCLEQACFPPLHQFIKRETRALISVKAIRARDFQVSGTFASRAKGAVGPVHDNKDNGDCNGNDDTIITSTGQSAFSSKA